MKKISLGALALLCYAQASACDICGCSVSNYNPFLFPHLSKTYIGLSFLQRHYHIINEDGSISKQYVNTWILSSQINAGKKLQLNILVPFQANNLRTGLSTARLSGFGDVSLTAGWKAWTRLTKISRQTVILGAGIKLPTGSNYPDNSEKLKDQVFSIGSGSVDYIIYGAYKAGYRKWFYNFSSTYKYNTANKAGFRYGDVLDVSLLAGRRIDIKKIAVSPYLQVGWQQQMQNAISHSLQSNSGSNMLLGNLGIDVNTKNLTVGLGLQIPAAQKIADDQIKMKPGISAHIAYNLKRNK